MSSFFAVLYFSGSAYGFLVATGLYLKKENRCANRILSTLIVLFSINLLKLGMDDLGLYRQFPHIIWMFTSAGFLFGPLIYFYISFLTGDIKKFSPKLLLHFIPFIVHLLFLLPFWVSSASDKVLQYERYLSGGFSREYTPLLTYSIKVVHYLVYVAVSFFRIVRYEKNYKNQCSTTGFHRLVALKTLLILNMLTLVSIICITMLHASKVVTMTHFYSRLSYLWITLILFILAYTSLRHKMVLELPEKDDLKSALKKYGDNLLPEKEASAYLQKLLEFMEKEKPYLDSNLNIAVLAHKTGIPRHVISQVINRKLKKNFFYFVNHYRLEYVKKLLCSNKNKKRNILSLALEAGFNSKSHFNTFFKKETGMTPSEFRKL